MFDRERPSALIRVDADRGGIADPGVERPFEVHDEDLAHIVSDPFLVDGDEKIAVFLRYNGPGYHLAVDLLRMQRCRTGKTQTTIAGPCIRHALNDWSKLNKLDSFIPEESIYLKRVRCSFSGYAGKHVVIDLVLTKKPESAHCSLE